MQGGSSLLPSSALTIALAAKCGPDDVTLEVESSGVDGDVDVGVAEQFLGDDEAEALFPGAGRS